MKDVLIEILESFCPDDVYLQGTLNPDEEFPQKFITFFVTITEEDGFFDNDASAVVWHFNVIFYSNNPEEVNTVPRAILQSLKQAGFIPQGIGNDMPSGRPSHTGWAMDVLYRQEENQ